MGSPFRTCSFFLRWAGHFKGILESPTKFVLLLSMSPHLWILMAHLSLFCQRGKITSFLKCLRSMYFVSHSIYRSSVFVRSNILSQIQVLAWWLAGSKSLDGLSWLSRSSYLLSYILFQLLLFSRLIRIRIIILWDIDSNDVDAKPTPI